MPQLDPSVFSPQLIWLAISFLVLYILMARVALPKVARVLKERETRIEGNIEKAEMLREQAEEALKAYEHAIAKAKAEAQAILQKGLQEIALETQNRESAFQQKMKAESDAAEAKISAAKNQAMAGIKDLAAELAQDIAEKLTGAMTDSKQASEAVAKAAMKMEA